MGMIELFLVFLLLSTGIHFYLSARQTRYVHSHAQAVPAEFSDQISLDAHQKAASYTLAKEKTHRIDLLLSTTVTALWIMLGGIEWLGSYTENWLSSPIADGILLILAFSAVNAIVGLPLSLYRTFVTEARFGFNKMTLGLFFSDLIKSTVLSLIILVPLLWAVLAFMDHFSDAAWWLWVWALWMTFSIAMMWLYPAVIAPIFNKFEELEDSSLKTRIEGLLKNCGFESNGIYVMDGSKRSSHGNAYFTGFGKNKRIVFFDTLIERLSEDEVIAVLAHELGHFHHKHIIKRMGVMAVISLAALYLLDVLLHTPEFFAGLRLTDPTHAQALLLFMIVLPVFTFWFEPLSARLSRKDEFEADAYAASKSDANNLVSALIKLYEDNAATLTPDPVRSAYYDSHPPALIRINALKQLETSND